MEISTIEKHFDKKIDFFSNGGLDLRKDYENSLKPPRYDT